MARVLVIGSALQDIYLIDRQDLKPTSINNESLMGKIAVGSKIDIDKISYEVGGSGLNAAVAFARHNHETIFLGPIGRDVAGDAILRMLNQENIDSSYINYCNQTGTSVILLDSGSGERTILTAAGDSKNFDDIDICDFDMIQPDWVYISTLFGNFTMLEKIIARAKKLGAKIMLAPGNGELDNNKKFLKLLKDVNIIALNKQEAAKIVPGTTLTELLSHLNNYVETVIITDGQMGGIASNRTETYRFGIYEDTNIKDTTGAGDAFSAGFLAHYAAHKSFRTSLIFASANSTAAISKIGASTNLLSGTEELHPMPIQKI